MKKRLGFFIFLFVIIVLSSFVPARASGTAAIWTRAFCSYNYGNGNYACDSGSVSGDSASCSAVNGVQCAQEGDVYCYGQAYDESGYTLQGPVNAYNVNWDTDSADCSCKVGAGRWDIPFEAGLQGQCCGDDSNEFYAGPSTGKSCDGTQACCNSASDYVSNSQCISACPSVTSVYFTDLIGDRITQADINDYVLLTAETNGAEGILVNFTVWEAGATSCYNENYSAYSLNGKASVLWKAKACPDGSNDGNKFRAFISTMPSVYNESELLSVNLLENDSLPVAVISSPIEGNIYNVGDSISFVSGSYDIDDPITSVLWNFDVYGSGETSSLANTTHSYSAGGPKFVTLTAQNARGKTSTTRIGILINSSANDPPLAVISNPAYGEKFSGMLITFNATMSTDDVKPFSQLIFTWQFDDGTVYSAKGIDGAYFTKLFSVAGEHNVMLSVDDSDPVSQTESLFYIKGCQVPLDGGYEFVPLSSCSSVSKHYFCNSNETYYDTMSGHCEGANGIAPDSDDCCPRGFYCPSTGSACTERPALCGNYNTSADCQLYGCAWLNGTCTDPAAMTSCSDYQSQEACNSDILKLGKVGGIGLGTDICGKTFGAYTIDPKSCMCKWYGDNSTGACQFIYSVNQSIGGEGFITCVKSFSLTDCVAGTQNMNWTVLILPPEMQGNATAQQQCSSGSKEIKCGTTVSKMPFFNILNAIIAVIILAAYYAFLARNKKIKRKKHKSGKKQQ